MSHYIPKNFRNEIFVQAFEKAEIAKYTDVERSNYEASLKTYRDLKGVIDTAFEDGKVKGKYETAKLMKDEGEPIDKIVKFTGLTKAMYDR